MLTPEKLPIQGIWWWCVGRGGGLQTCRNIFRDAGDNGLRAVPVKTCPWGSQSAPLCHTLFTKAGSTEIDSRSKQKFFFCASPRVRAVPTSALTYWPFN